MAIELFINDERPQWPATIVENGTRNDYSTGYTFTCIVTTNDAAKTTLLTKTTNITGGANGAVTVAFTGSELSGAGVTATAAVTPQTYKVYLTARQTSDSTDASVDDILIMKWRP